MKRSYRLIIVFITAVLFFSSCRSQYENTAVDGHKKHYLYLIAGFDEAAENTDVLMTLGYNADNKQIMIAQIPRDTFYNSGIAQNKINQIYSFERANGKTKNEAMDRLTRELSQAFGTEFDGYIGLGINTFKQIIDSIGGVDLEIPYDLDISDVNDDHPIVLRKGKNHINGKLAERFVRHRSNYLMGDLARIDAQKLFINSLFLKIMNDMSLPQIIELSTIFKKDMVTDIKISDSIPIAADIISSRKMSVSYATLPGESILNKNLLSFYVLNRKSAAEIANRYMFANEEFDVSQKFLNRSEVGFSNIYFDECCSAREFSDESIGKVRIY